MRSEDSHSLRDEFHKVAEMVRMLAKYEGKNRRRLLLYGIVTTVFIAIYAPWYVAVPVTLGFVAFLIDLYRRYCALPEDLKA